MTCPHCGHPLQFYTDPNLQTRCQHCFNHVFDIPGVPIGRLQNLDAPMTIAGITGTHVYPGAYTRLDRPPWGP